jgi:ribose transport system substrate-binding protein
MKTRYALAFLAALAVAGCNSGSTSTEGTTGSTPAATNENKPLVAFAQANSKDPWRQVFDAETKAAAEKHSMHFSFESQTADDDPTKQISIIETFLLKNPKVLLVSAATEAVQTATDKAFDKGIPVILLDRAVPGDKWTAYVGGDNVEIGREVGKYMVEELEKRLGKGKKAIVLMIQGISDVSATRDRREGAMEVFKQHPNIEVIMGNDCKYQRQAAQSYMESFLQSGRPFDAVYAHNDEMAIGAYMAYESAAKKPLAKPLFVGVDACQQEVVEMIKDGKLDATFTYPVPGPKAIELAAEIIEGKMPTEKKFILPTQRITKENADDFLKSNPNLAK